jgi:MFS family permease
MGIPPELVQRSAAARAEADGTSIDDILAAWAGGAPPPAPSAPPQDEPAAEAEAQPEPEPEKEAEPAAAAVAVMEEPETPQPVLPEVEPEPEEPLEPAPLGLRLKTAVRIGAWTGAALGVVGFLAASAFWAPNTTALPDSGPVVQVGPTGLLIGVVLVSVIFGAVVAGVSRAATGWSNPAMQLSGSKASTMWVGAAIGVVLGVVAGAMLGGLGTPVEGSDPPLVQLPVLSTLFVMVIGGAILGAATALVPQLLGVPVAIDEEDSEEVETVKTRLGNAIGIPLAGVLLLVFLVIPFGFTLIESNHLAPGVGGAVVAIIAAGGILGFSALAGSRPEMKISFGDLMVAVVGIGVVLIIIISVMFALQGDDDGEDHAENAAIVQVI